VLEPSSCGFTHARSRRIRGGAFRFVADDRNPQSPPARLLQEGQSSGGRLGVQNARPVDVGLQEHPMGLAFGKATDRVANGLLLAVEARGKQIAFAREAQEAAPIVGQCIVEVDADDHAF
jgi:hypothetical protein